jgi:hypothetical protein
LESQTPPEMIDDRAGRIAVHADQGGEPELAHRYALRASQEQPHVTRSRRRLDGSSWRRPRHEWQRSARR